MTPTAPVPNGFRVALDPTARRLAPDVLFGGVPARVIRLSEAGQAVLATLNAAPIASRAAGMLARRLTDAGLAHPRPTELTQRPDVTVVIPVHDRPRELDRCLGALGASHPIVVVDDASREAEAIAKVAAEHGARLIRRASNGGPGAARNTGLDVVTTELVAMIDSDCVPTAGWIGALAAHLVDPLVAVAAPRIAAAEVGPCSGRPRNEAVSRQRPGYAARYATARGILDLGAVEARVQPLGRVAFVPSAAFVARTAVLREHGGFDAGLRTGEDVDLIWRLHKAGHRIRYDTRATVTHHEPDQWRVLLRRRFRYGTSAGALARRHPEAMPPLVLNPWPAAAVAGAIAASPAVIVAGVVGSYVQTKRALRKAEVPTAQATRMAAAGIVQTWLASGRYAAQLGFPLLLAALLRRRTRPAVAALLLGPALINWWRGGRGRLDPFRFTAAHLVDDAVYGAGVWAGAISERTSIPLTPVGTRRARKALQQHG